MSRFLQKLGRSLMLPVAVLPICGVLMGLGYLICPAAIQGGEIAGVVETAGFLAVKAGSAVIDHIAWLFVIGVAVGMSDDGDGAAALSGLVSFLVILTLLSDTVTKMIFPGMESDSLRAVALKNIENPFTGMLSGLIGAFCYNRFRKVRLPDALAFFSGKRFSAIVTVLFSLITAFALMFIWPSLYSGLYFIGEKILSLGAVGAGIYAFLNRLLIPTGLHHALNNVFWFDTVGIGDLTAFWSGKTAAEAGWSVGMYMSGFFPCFMFGIPGAALAMYQTAKNRKKEKAKLFSSSLCSVLCGLTEPFEFSFMFSAFPLYVVYSLLCGVFTMLTCMTGFRAGFSFSAGAADLLLSASLPAAAETWLILPLGAAAFAAFYGVFRLALKKGRFNLFEAETGETGTVNDAPAKAGSSRAAVIIAAVGGRDNIRAVECCATRLRFELEDSALCDQSALAGSGALGMKIGGKNACQVIIGMTVQQVLEEVKGELASPSRALPERPAIPCERASSGNDGAAVLTVTCTGDRHILHGEDLFFARGGEFVITVQDDAGLHARPAAKLSERMKAYDACVTVCANGREASAVSVIALMGLGIAKGTEVRVTARGAEAEEALLDARRLFIEELKGQ